MRRTEAITYAANTIVRSMTDRPRRRSRSARRVSAALPHSQMCSVTFLAPRSECHDRSCLHLLARALAIDGERQFVQLDDVRVQVFLVVGAGVEDLPVATRAFDLRRLLQAPRTAEQK